MKTLEMQRAALAEPGREFRIKGSDLHIYGIWRATGLAGFESRTSESQIWKVCRPGECIFTEYDWEWCDSAKDAEREELRKQCADVRQAVYSLESETDVLKTKLEKLERKLEAKP